MAKFLCALLFISLFSGPLFAENLEKATAPSNKSQAITITWVDLAFINYVPIPNTRFADFSKTNFGGSIGLNFMICDLKPLWVFLNFMTDANLPNTNRMERLVDIGINIGLGWRFALIKDKFYLTPRISYGYMLHASYGSYFNEQRIYLISQNTFKRKYYNFSDQFMQYGAEFAVDISPGLNSGKVELFLSPEFIHFIEIHRQGLEVGYKLGVRFNVETNNSVDVRRAPTLEMKPVNIWGIFGHVYEKNTSEPLRGVEVIVTEAGNEKKAELATDGRGDFRIELKSDTDYRVVLKKRKYFTVQGAFTTKGKKPGWFDVHKFMSTEFQKVEVGTTIDFGNIYYDSGSSYIRPGIYPELDKIVQFLSDNPTIVVELSAHTDALGDARQNMILSQKRAQSAVDYLIKKGIKAERITAKGYGKTKIKNRCVDGVACSAEEHKVNRRTEIRVLRITQE
jgi:outer membrane protein OmpA-like peptidoglycan-associated protein